MEDGDVHFFSQALLHDEALRRLDVLKVDGAKGGLHGLDDFNEGFRLLDVQLNVKDIHVCINLEQKALALHHGFGGMGADVAEAEHGGAVADDAHQVAAPGVEGGGGGVCRNLKAGFCHAGRIGEGQVIYGEARLARQHFQLAGSGFLVVLQCSLS